MDDLPDELLDPIQLRVLASLAEKEATVPETYPLTAKALQAACNQRTSRDPVLDLDEGTIQRTLDALKARGLVRFVHASHGARSTRFRHVLDERLDLDRAGLALLTVLALRGPQTVAELRTRTERAHPFASEDEVVAALGGLATRTPALVVELPRRSGQREARWAHLLSEPVDLDSDPAPLGSGVAAARTVSTVGAGLEARLAALEARVELLEALLDAAQQAGDEPGEGAEP